MRAARRFAVELEAAGVLARVAEVRVDLYGSLALTGLGHGTDRAVLLGLSGEEAATIDPATIEPKLRDSVVGAAGSFGEAFNSLPGTRTPHFSS
jgi:hypothetical protein